MLLSDNAEYDNEAIEPALNWLNCSCENALGSNSELKYLILNDSIVLGFSTYDLSK
ncbi:hypothetical protein NW739_04090 [Mycoplasmopsis felis]|nr:hypothetical protein [Mycoplasmopsis felis]MCU9934311.1 hypothetical protein [Mycoplasmopsis felis]MCU9938531.1 hypothetical protein [Mycoplasmopsis felis]MCU9939896.1 hypothetical protein [Mycoplasmopsis felis]UWV79729.1 hypothetical protein NW072_00760 [Mycoplasmopsis felis]WAM00976.1 hypothetical protein NWE60_06280 [Mycoplasmopsis felis]